MLVIQPVPSAALRAQLVGLGLIPQLHDVTPMPPLLAQRIQEAFKNGPSTGNGSGVTDPPVVPPPPVVEEKGTNWLLWGGVAAGAVLLGALFLRR